MWKVENQLRSVTGAGIEVRSSGSVLSKKAFLLDQKFPTKISEYSIEHIHGNNNIEKSGYHKSC